MHPGTHHDALEPPAASPSDPAELPAGHGWFEHTRSADARWHFALVLSERARVVGAGEAPPDAALATRSLGLFAFADRAGTSEASIEVLGHALEHEVDPADWLDAWPGDAPRPEHVVARRPVTVLSGVVGDVDVRFEHADEPWAARYLATKWGPRLFVVACRARLADYAAHAESFAAAVASFRALDHGLGAFAERVRVLEGRVPFAWELAVPASWQAVQFPEEPEGTWLDATHTVPTELGRATGELDGRLSVAIFARARALRPRDAVKPYLRALRDNDTWLEHVDFSPEPPSAPFGQSWYLVTPIVKDQARGELRCRVMLHERAWLVAGVLGPARARDRDAWMRNKRVLDVVTATFRVRGRRAPGGH
ncbi:MAG: hypothetical protein HY908_04110 [Myxococcales bacterium]|nr:hypothetical protein [Myxococcales bacterium]